MRTGSVDTIALSQLPIGSPEGLTLSYVSATQISIAAGRAVIGGTSRSIAVLATALTKSLSSVWAAGTGQGMRASGAGAVAANQTWHIFVIRNTTSGAVDIQADTSATGANLTSGWVGRMIGSIMTDASSNIRSFSQTGDRFDWTSAVADFSSMAATPTNATNLLTLTVPTGVAVVAFGRMGTGTMGNALNASNPAVGADAIAYSTAGYAIGRFEETTNTSAQIKFYATVANSNGDVLTRGFYHPRGAY